MKNILSLILAVLLLVSTGIRATAARAEALTQNDQPTVVYEAVFLDNDEITQIFADVRGSEAPYPIMTQNFHVTTSFMPEQAMREAYGTEVAVHIYAYQTGEVKADDGSMTANEGFFCTVSAQDADLQHHLDSLDKNWHITGSYRDQGGAKYTAALDLTGARKVERTVMGRFGGYMSDGSIALAAENDSLPGEERIARLYEQSGMEHIYSLSRLGLESYSVEAAEMKDGYILLDLSDGPRDRADAGRIMLMPIGDPDAAVSRACRFGASYDLLGHGNVLETTDGAYTLYNADLQEVSSGQAGGSFLGASDDGDLWFLTSDEKLVLHRGGEPVLAIDAPGVTYGTYLGKSDGKAYFELISTERGQLNLCADLKELRLDTMRTLRSAFDMSDGTICYLSDDRWYMADLADPFIVTAFTRPCTEENMWRADDCYLVSCAFRYDEAAHSTHNDYCVYDMHTGAVVDRRSSLSLAEHEAVMLAYDRGLILYADTDRDADPASTKLYLWDVRGLPAMEPAQYHTVLDFHVDQERVESLIDEIGVMYDVAVFYDAEHLAAVQGDHCPIPSDDLELVGYTLILLKECMAEYPCGFFDDIRTAEYGQVAYYLCGGHMTVSADAYPDVSATTRRMDDKLVMTYDVSEWWSMRSHFLHENTHMMEDRLEAEAWKINDTFYNKYWYEELNSPECPSMQSYVWTQSEENLKGVYSLDGENAWYIDAYSKCTTSEDRARIMDRGLYTANDKYFQSPHIDRKSRFMAALIREVFPCVRDQQEEVFWERRTGIVGLYEEFPDFAGKR